MSAGVVVFSACWLKEKFDLLLKENRTAGCLKACMVDFCDLSDKLCEAKVHAKM